MSIFKNISFFVIILFAMCQSIFADEINVKDKQLNFYIGNFDFSDDKQKATLVGFQHQD